MHEKMKEMLFGKEATNEEFEEFCAREEAEENFSAALREDVDFKAMYQGLHEHLMSIIFRIAAYSTDAKKENAKDVLAALLALKKALKANNRWEENIEGKIPVAQRAYLRLVDGQGDNI